MLDNIIQTKDKRLKNIMFISLVLKEINRQCIFFLLNTRSGVSRSYFRSMDVRHVRTQFREREEVDAFYSKREEKMHQNDIPNHPASNFASELSDREKHERGGGEYCLGHSFKHL